MGWFLWRWIRCLWELPVVLSRFKRRAVLTLPYEDYLGSLKRRATLSPRSESGLPKSFLGLPLEQANFPTPLLMVDWLLLAHSSQEKTGGLVWGDCVL
jgi:hypothetical protein